MNASTLRLVLHGGAGVLPDRDYGPELTHMRGLIEAGRDRLLAGASAVEVVTETIEALEVSGLYVAGRGSSPNRAGRYELDASLMHGADQRLGAVAALQGFRSPIRAAREVLEAGEHVLLVADGAGAFARERRLTEIDDDAAWFTPAWRDAGMAPDDLRHGTVGCVALDGAGQLAAGTSTGGTFGKRPGRVGDTPIAGAGVWADERVAISCTGEGEMFIRAAAAAQIAFRLRLAGQPLAEACAAALADVRRLGGDGGLIALTAEGEISAPFITRGMKRAMLGPGGEIEAAVF